MKKKAAIGVLSVMLAAAIAACGSSAGNSAASSEAVTAAQSTGETTAEAKTDSTTDWPKGGIQMIIPLKAGGDTDFYGRTYSQYLEKELGVTITAMNVEGAGGTVGATQASKAKPDGNTMLFYHTGNMFTNEMLGTSDLQVDDFEIAAVGVLDNTNVLVAGKNSGFTDGKDFLEKVKDNPKKYSVATTISGFSYYVVCKAEAVGGFELNPVDAGGASDMIPKILGNQCDLAMNSYGVFKQYVESGDVIPLMVFSEKRNPNFPDVPTAKELGLDCTAERAYFFAFPKGTDQAIVKKLSDAVGAVQDKQDYKDAIAKQYCVEPFYKSCDEAADYIKAIHDDMMQYKDALNNSQ